MRSTCLWLLLNLGVFSVGQTARADSTVYTFGTTFQGAKNYHGAIFDGNAKIGVSESVDLMPGFRHLERSYSSEKFDETTGYLSVLHRMGGGFYAVHEIAGTPNAIILPRVSYLGQFHYASGRDDFGVNAGYAKYYNLESASIGPNYYHTFNPAFAMSAGMTFARADRWLSAGMAQAIFTANERSEGRLIYASGEILEAAGLQARFSSVTLEAMLAVAKRVRFGFGLTTYRSNLRSEDSAMLRFEVR